MELLKRFVREEDGAPATEYALLIGLIALAIIVGVTAVGTNLNDKFQSIADFVDGISVP